MTVTINGTTGVSGVAGSASTPALIGSDADSGYYINSANEPNASVNGTAVWNAASSFGFKNRIINGAMQIAQYGAGPTAVTTSSSYLTLDRYIPTAALTNGVITMAQASSNPPVGFTNYMSFATVSGLSSLAAGDLFGFQQRIEGYNIADLGFGTANAKTVTLSFWVYSSVAGTYGGAFRGATFSREYVFSYTITSANTWQYVTITVPGDTTGSWLTNNATGLSIFFSFGSGSTYTGATGSWIAGGGILAPTGQANAVATTGNVFNITGIQLEKGSTATSFDFRPYGTELQLCQRYYAKLTSIGLYAAFASGYVSSATGADVYLKYPVAMRAAATVNYSTIRVNSAAAAPAVTSLGGGYAGSDSAFQTFVVASGLTTGQGALIVSNNSTSGYIDLSAEL